ncbi:quercetin 2,3-dioxygenase, partial [Tremellales sp. Uapishka_1]
MKFQFRPSPDRGNADHGWLKSFHTFSFADYYDPSYQSFGSLRVINEDRVAPRTGFPTHPHREAEIFSYIINGELTHKDNMKNVETMKRGDLQMTSGGTGIAHSEYNDHPSHFTDEQKADKICEIVAPVTAEGIEDTREGSGPAPVHAALYFSASVLSPSKSVTYAMHPPTTASIKNKLFYVQLVQVSGYNTSKAKGTTITVSSGSEKVELKEGDGVFVRNVKEGDKFEIANVGEGKPEVVMFEMDDSA